MSNCHRNRRRPASSPRQGLYRSRRGIVFGVCKGIADYAQIDVIWVRLLLLLVAFLTSFLPVLIGYLVAAILIKPAPAEDVNLADDADWEFYNSYSNNRHLALSRLKRKFDQIERRTSRLESSVTQRAYDWDVRLHSGR